jgi:hypothetical protein
MAETKNGESREKGGNIDSMDLFCSNSKINRKGIE